MKYQLGFLIASIGLSFCINARASVYECKVIVGFPAGSGDTQEYTVDTLADGLNTTYENYQFFVTKLPASAGRQIQLRITDPWGGMATTDIADGYKNPFVANRHDNEQSAAQLKCVIQS